MPKPFIPSPIFPAAKAHYDALSEAAEVASKRLRAIPGIGSGPMGLTPDAIKFSPEYREASAAYQRAAGILKDYAKGYCRTFKREIAADRDARRAALIGKA
jgi:hypothetical protein